MTNVREGLQEERQQEQVEQRQGRMSELHAADPLKVEEALAALKDAAMELKRIGVSSYDLHKILNDEWAEPINVPSVTGAANGGGQ
jgi:hypothetical protein